MERILNCAIIDDDSEIHTIIKGFLKGSEKALINQCFEKCTDFLETINYSSIDLVFLDCLFPNDSKNGVDVAIKLKEIGKHFIFISAKHHSFVDACRTIGALDAMPKPLTEKRFMDSIDTAYNTIISSKASKKKHTLFHVKEHKGKINIFLPDILYVRTQLTDSRNKIVRLKNGISYTLMGCKFEELLTLSEDFVMANKSELISYNIVEGMEGEFVLLNQKDNNKIPKKILLSPLYKNNFEFKLH
jgi:DNA-binding LytR/AlgR family response regulator